LYYYDLPGIARQIKRRNSLGDLSSTTSKKLRESIGISLSKTVEEQVKSDLDEHIKTLRETIKKKTRNNNRAKIIYIKAS
jgi:hypothetical protein